jgi:hypothetical protein
MKDHDASRHPGPWRVMNVDSESAGILVAVGFLAMGLVSIPVARWFVLGCLALGAAVAVLLRFSSRRFTRLVGRLTVGSLIVLAAFALWPSGHVHRPPHNVSSNAVYVLPSNSPRSLFETGYWLECWFDQRENVDRCKLSDDKGNGVFEDIFVTCGSQATVPQSELVIQPETGRRWIQSHDVRIVNVPVPYVRYGQILFPRSLYAEAKQQGYCYGD